MASCEKCKKNCEDNMKIEKYRKGILPLVEECLDFELIQTNADRIRAMSDEDLADFLYGIDHWCDDGQCIVTLDSEPMNDFKTDILDWLQSEV